MNKTEIIDILKTQKESLNQKFSILKIGLFGSYATNTNNPDSDIDLIFELEQGKYLGLKEMYDLEQLTQNLFNTENIDLVNQKYLNPIIATAIEKTVIYV